MRLVNPQFELEEAFRLNDLSLYSIVEEAIANGDIQP